MVDAHPALVAAFAAAQDITEWTDPHTRRTYRWDSAAGLWRRTETTGSPEPENTEGK
jgi:hypothetical protein